MPRKNQNQDATSTASEGRQHQLYHLAPLSLFGTVFVHRSCVLVLYALFIITCIHTYLVASIVLLYLQKWFGYQTKVILTPLLGDSITWCSYKIPFKFHYIIISTLAFCCRCSSPPVSGFVEHLYATMYFVRMKWATANYGFSK
jgi:hypothetical protein